MLCAATVDIKGLDNCVIESEKNIKIREYDEVIKDIKLRQYERTIQNNTERVSKLEISFWPIEFEKDRRTIFERLQKTLLN